MNDKVFNYNDGNINFQNLNGINFINPDSKKFPVIKLLKKISNKNTYFETILITINDVLVDKYLRGQINYQSLNDNIFKLIKIPYFSRFYNHKPKNIIDIKIMVRKVTTYLNKIKIN